jgi:hypothetical protein
MDGYILLVITHECSYVILTLLSNGILRCGKHWLAFGSLVENVISPNTLPETDV